MKSFPVTGHMIVVNEDRFVWYAIMSVLPYLNKILIYLDEKSIDNTEKIIKSEIINNSRLDIRLRRKINFKKVIISTPEKLGQLRIQQVKETDDPWFLVIDGDEIWPPDQILKLLKLTQQLPKTKIGVVNSTRNCVGDVWHYLPMSAGRYQLLGRTGHYTIRLMRNLEYTLGGTFPYEGYCWQNKLINQLNERLFYCDGWYLHTTHLIHSSLQKQWGRHLSKFTFSRRNLIIEKGIQMNALELPRILFENRKGSAEILKKRSWYFEMIANLITPVKGFKRRLLIGLFQPIIITNVNIV